MADVPAYTDFTTTFDAYRVTGIRFRWVSIRDPNQTGVTINGTVGYYPRVMWVYDYNDMSSPGSFADLQQYNNVKEVYLSAAKPMTRWYYFRPKDLQTIAGGYAQRRRSSWLRINEANVLHYGLKYVYDSNQSGQQLRLEAYYYMQFKAVK